MASNPDFKEFIAGLENRLTISLETTFSSLKRSLLAESERKGEFILLLGRYESLKTNNLRGVIDTQNTFLYENVIRKDLLTFIHNLKEVDVSLEGSFLQKGEKGKSGETTSALKNSKTNSGVLKKVYAIACGYGWWARNRTISPFLLENSDVLEIVAITNLHGRKDEYEEIKNELNELNYKRKLPKKIYINDLVEIPPDIANDFSSCYTRNPESDFYHLSDEFFEIHKRRVLDYLYNNRPYLLKPKILVPEYFQELLDAILKYKSVVQAVIINTPNSLHSDLAELALRKKLNVYAERPINPYKEKLGNLLFLASKNKKLLYSGVQRRLEDTFRYFHYVVKHKIFFNQLKTIKIYLASGRRLKGWRLDKKRAGGGIVTDEGYHLLDAASWVAKAADPDVRYDHFEIKGNVTFRYDPVSWLGNIPDNIETSAFGSLHLSNDVDLKFDFSYNAPENSVFEFFEIRDNEGNMVRLLRDLARRTPQPAIITHQLSNGELVAPPFPMKKGDEKKEEGSSLDFANDFSIKMDKISFFGQAKTSGPLSQFLANILSEQVYNENTKDFSGIECDANLLVNTDELVKAIYHLEENSHKKK